MKHGSVAAAAKDSVHPRLQSGASVRPLNFTVRRHVSASASFLLLSVSVTQQEVQLLVPGLGVLHLRSLRYRKE